VSARQTGGTTPTPTETPIGTEAATPPGSEYLPPALREILTITPPWVVDILQSVVVLVVAYVVSQLLVRLLGRRIARRFRRPSLTRTVLRGIRVAVGVFALLTILGIYGYRLSDIALSVTVFTAVLGVILAPIVGSVISGVFLLADQPYEIGDMVELADRGQRGFVEDITLRYTKIFTLDNTFLVVPNGTMRERDVVNYSAEDTRTRQTLDLLVTYESDIQRARDLFESSARTVDGVVEGGPGIRVGSARYPAGPTCYIDAYADHGVNLRLRYWVEEPYWLLRVRSRIQTALGVAIEDEDIEIAYPHQHHVFDETSGTMQVSVVGEDESGDRHRRPDRGPGNAAGVTPDSPETRGMGAETVRESPPKDDADGPQEGDADGRREGVTGRGTNVDPGHRGAEEAVSDTTDETAEDEGETDDETGSTT
jgi:small-conductance mechanosensitive channel